MNLFDILFQGQNFARLMQGLGVTFYIALVSSLLTIIFGVLLGLLMTLKNPAIKIITRAYLEFFRIMPQLVLLFVLYFSLSSGVQGLSPEEASIIVFSMWGAAEMGDLVRGAISNVAFGQKEAGKALGLNTLALNRFIVLPQAFRQLIPVSINLITRIIKTTSIVPLIGVVEVLKVGQQIVDFNRVTFPTASIAVYGVIFVMYFLICYPLSVVAKRLER